MIDEDFLLKQVFSKFSGKNDLAVGPGDDCAVFCGNNSEYLLFAVDQVVGDTHYLSDKTTPGEIAAKLVKRNISDLAAMGGKPMFAVSSAALANRKSQTSPWLIDFFTSLNHEASKWDLCICGGDISGSKNEYDVFSLAVIGQVTKEKLCLRKNAKPGELIFCTGHIGNSFCSKHHLNFTPRLREAEFLAGNFTQAVIDISDGLLKDLERMISMSQVGAKLKTSTIPLRKGAKLPSALTEGEDYELLFTVMPEKKKQLLEHWPFSDVNITEIGLIMDEFTGKIMDIERNSFFDLNNMGFDHFRED